MYKLLRFSVILFLLTYLPSCHRRVNTGESSSTSQTPFLRSMEEKIEQVARDQYEGAFEIFFNAAQEIVLVRKTVSPQPGSIYPTVYFFIYNPATEAILFKDVIIQAKEVHWISNSEVLATSIPGRLEDPDDPNPLQGYIYNIMTRTKRSLKK